MHAHIRRGFFLLLLGFSPWNAKPASAFDLGFNGFWEHRAAGGKGLAIVDSLQHRYSIDAGQGTGFSLQPTHALTAGANVVYNRRDTDAGVGLNTVRREELTPTANIGIANDIFRTSLVGSTTKSWLSSSDTRTTSQSWDAVIGSNWGETYWPVLTFDFGASTNSNISLTTLENEIENKRNGFTLDWELPVATLYYSINHNQSESRYPQTDGSLNRAENTSDSQFFRLETGGNFWQERIRLNFAQQIQKSASDFSSQAGLVPLTPAPDIDTFSVKSFYDSGQPIEESWFAGESLTDPAFPLSDASAQKVLNPDERFFLRIDAEKALFTQAQLDKVYFTLTDTFTIHAPSLADAAKLEWTLYIEDPATGSFLPQGSLNATYNTAANRIELDLDQKLADIGQPDAKRVGVLVKNPADGAIIGFNSIECFTFFSTPVTGSSRGTASLTNASMQVKLTKTLTASTAMTLEQAESESGAATSETSTRSLSSSLRWTPTPYVMPTLRYSENLQEATGSPDALDRAYSLVVATYPLKTLNITLGATRRDRFSGASKTATSDNFSLTSTAQIYPDLSAALSTSYLTGSQRLTDTTTETDTLNNRLTVTARITPRLIADFTGNHRQSKSSQNQTTTTSTGATTTASLSYRPSDLLLMRLINTKDWENYDDPATWVYDMQMSLLRTQKTQLTVRYNHSRSTITRHGFGLDGNWDLSRKMALRTLFNYDILDDRSYWNVTTSLSLKL